MKYYIDTFGCKSNQYESQAMREILERDGFTAAQDACDADVYVLNTCGVTGAAAAACRSRARQAARRNPGVLVAVTGCCVDLGEEFTGVQNLLLLANARKTDIAALIRERLGFAGCTQTAGQELSVSAFSGHTRAFLKVQDGCDNFCTYCAVPYARGAPRSRPVAAVLDEARRLVDAGYGEIVLTGINIGVYRDGAADFSDLAQKLAQTPGLVRLRLGSVEPPQADRRLFQVMHDEPRICPHLHLPLQAGSDAVLSAMGRRYASGQFLDIVALAKEILDKPSLTTDVIVGFPGETEADFESTMQVCAAAGFSRLHVFPFSPRPGTPAASLRQNTPNREIESRKKQLIARGALLAEQYAQSLVGMDERVIVEKDNSGFCDRYIRVTLPPGQAQGAVVRVRLQQHGPTLAGALQTPS